MSGVTESSAGLHKTREPTSDETQFIDDILELYQLRPNEKSYSHYAEEAVFHDPISIAKGLESIKSQFNGMPRIFAKSITEHVAVLDTSTPQALQLNLTQNYFFKSPIPGKSEGTNKVVNSKLTFTRNSQGLITEHLEEWDHEKNKTSEDGFWGKIQEGRKKISATMVDTFVSSDPSKA